MRLFRCNKSNIFSIIHTSDTCPAVVFRLHFVRAYFEMEICRKTFRPKCSFIKSIPGHHRLVQEVHGDGAAAVEQRRGQALALVRPVDRSSNDHAQTDRALIEACSVKFDILTLPISLC
jgi:hypothetical protein